MSQQEAGDKGWNGESQGRFWFRAGIRMRASHKHCKKFPGTRVLPSAPPPPPPPPSCADPRTHTCIHYRQGGPR
ncbi:hypothetical protein FKM82_025605 [Ascaphus truei]